MPAGVHPQADPITMLQLGYLSELDDIGSALVHIQAIEKFGHDSEAILVLHSIKSLYAGRARQTLRRLEKTGFKIEPGYLNDAD